MDGIERMDGWMDGWGERKEGRRKVEGGGWMDGCVSRGPSSSVAIHSWVVLRARRLGRGASFGGQGASFGMGGVVGGVRCHLRRLGQRGGHHFRAWGCCFGAWGCCLGAWGCCLGVRGRRLGRWGINCVV